MGAHDAVCVLAVRVGVEDEVHGPQQRQVCSTQRLVDLRTEIMVKVRVEVRVEVKIGLCRERSIVEVVMLHISAVKELFESMDSE